MAQRYSFRQYRWIDLGFFAGMLVVSEWLIVQAARVWFPDQLYTVSVVAAITAIVLMRWGIYAGIHAFLGGLLFCFASGGTPKQYLIYCLGNLFSLLALLWIRFLGSERIREDSALSVMFALTTQLLMQAGRFAIAVVIGLAQGKPLLEGMARSVGFFTTDTLSCLFTALIIWIARRLDGIFEDQKHYLLRINRTEEE